MTCCLCEGSDLGREIVNGGGGTCEECKELVGGECSRHVVWGVQGDCRGLATVAVFFSAEAGWEPYDGSSSALVGYVGPKKLETSCTLAQVVVSKRTRAEKRKDSPTEVQSPNRRIKKSPK